MARKRPEAKIQEALAALLDAWGVEFTATGAEEPDKIRAINAKRMGVRAGFPDLLIFDPPLSNGGEVCGVGSAVELKSMTGGASKIQLTRHDRLRRRGWHVLLVPRGLMPTDAFTLVKDWLVARGYDRVRLRPQSAWSSTTVSSKPPSM